jgi:diguanylate cyclase (GGDEF)-like protein/PAS domain S-box-containing protein
VQSVRAVPSGRVPVHDRRNRSQRGEGMPHDLANLMPAAVYTARTGADGAWLYASPQIEEILGHTAQEFLDDPGLWARLLHPDDRDWVLAQENGAMVVTDERSYAEYRLVAKDGHVVWVLDDVTLQSESGGSVQHGLLFDITQRKVAELLIEEQADVLERIALGEDLDSTLGALAEALLRVTGAASCAVALARSGATYVAGTPVRDDLHPGIRVPFRHQDGTVLGELLVSGVGDVPDLDAEALSLGWAQRLAALAVDRSGQAEREARSFSLLAATLESTADGILVVDGAGRIVSCNQKFRCMWDIPETLIEAGDDDALLEHVMDQLVDRDAFIFEVRRLYAHPELSTVDELAFKDGRIFERVSQPQLLDARAVGRVWSFRDVTAFRQLESDLRHQAYTDDLTSLPNRNRFMQRLAELVPEDQADGPVADGHAILLVDVDDFKTVNDGLGHLAGDRMLVALAERVSRRVRADDMAARLGGDEFALLVACPGGPDDAQGFAGRLIEELSSPVDIDGRVLSVRVSVGIALSDGETPARDLMRNADLAMYTAKREGGACFRAYTTGMHDEAISRLDLKADLERAIAEDAVSVAYQPVVSLETGQIEGFEALARWQHPTLGAISPAEFIPLAEETGLIGRLGHWVLSRVCADVADWRALLGPTVPPVSVNLSPLQLADPELADQVAAVMAENGLPPSAIVLEVTESGLGTSDTDDVSSTLVEIRDLGIRLALDDFGTGHSSLARLGSYPFDVVKIDRSFVVRLTDGHRDQAVVQAVLQLADAFALDVIAEGVETQDQRQLLEDLGCERVQGFLFSRPVVPTEAFRLLAAATSLG